MPFSNSLRRGSNDLGARANSSRPVRAVRGAVVVTALAVAVSACVAGPNFSAPPPPSDQRYTQAPLPDLTQRGDVRLDPSLPMPAQWWTLLGSERLDATIREALAGNYNLAAARQRLAQAQELTEVANAALYPQVDLTALAARQKYGAAFLGPQFKLPAFDSFEVGPNISYAFDFAGGRRRTVEQQRALAQSQQQELQAAALAVSGNVAMQALAIAAAQSQLDALEAVLADDRRNLQLVQDAFNAGSATRVDVLNAQSQLANDQTLLPPLRRQIALAQHALALLVGRTPASYPTPDFRLSEFRLPPQLPLAVPSELAHRRPDIQAAEAQLHAATAAVGIAAANLYPQIDLSANASLQSNVLGALFDIGNGGYGLTGGLTAPLFNHGALRARQRAAMDAMHAALADYQQALLSAFSQVADSLEALDHDQELLASEQSAFQISAQSLTLTRESYTAGNSGVLQVLDAQRLNEEARLGLVRVQGERYQDTVQLLLALGGSPPASAAVPPAAGPSPR
jgi:NodT family efflux transporter outer membrane factor (OMF) lipoprotein